MASKIRLKATTVRTNRALYLGLVWGIGLTLPALIGYYACGCLAVLLGLLSLSGAAVLSATSQNHYKSKLHDARAEDLQRALERQEPSELARAAKNGLSVSETGEEGGLSVAEAPSGSLSQPKEPS